MDAREYLQSYPVLKMEVQNNEDRILSAFNNTQMPAPQSSDYIQKGPVGRGIQESATIRYIELKDRLQPQIDAGKEKLHCIEDIVNCIDDGLEREVLRLRYIDGAAWKPVPWKDVAIKLFGDDDERHMKAVQRLHKKALISFDASRVRCGVAVEIRKGIW